ncbi:MAG TPA: shikimate dehydrogenase [Clostridiales bacterium]|nr:shikimate dehydrogenase [Clostridiales bacterium]
MRINAQTKLLGLIGHPIGHSMSPTFHNRVYSLINLNAVYIAFDVKDKKQLKMALQGIRGLNIMGMNVTIPYKEEVIPYLDQLSKDAAIIGAVNVINNDNGRLIGYNSDAMGFASMLKNNGVSINNKDALILGAGGAAKAIAVVLAMNGARRITIANRSIERAKKLADLIRTTFPDTVAQVRHIGKEGLTNDAHLIINATSVGMWPHDQAMPISPGQRFHKEQIVVDIIYNPQTTLFLKEAQKWGCKTINGMEMLIYQALESIRIWTGINVEYSQVKECL